MLILSSMNPALAAQPGFDPYASNPDTAGLWNHLPLLVRGHAHHHRMHHDVGGDVGWFGSKLVHSVSHAVSKAANAVGKAAGSVVSGAAKGIVKVAEAPINITNHAIGKVIPGSEKYLNYASAPVKFIGKTAVNTAAGAVQGAINTAVHPNLNNLVNTASMTLKAAGPVGMIASGALGAMKAGLQGKNLESIAWAAAEGAAPPGIDKAIQAAENLRHGANVITTALNVAGSGFMPGTPELQGFNTAIATLKGTASKVALGVARKALPTEGAKRAFDSAIGTLSQAAKGAPTMNRMFQRAGGIPNIVLHKAPQVLSAVPSATKSVVDAIRNNPTLMAGNHQLLAQTMRTNAATVKDAMAIVSRKPGSMLPWRSLEPHVVSFIRKYVPSAPLTALRHAHTNVGGLDSTGTTYIVEKGDGPWAIAQKLSGNGNNWKMLLDYNKDKKPTVDKNVWVGEVLNLPPSWQKPVVVAPVPVKALPLPPVNTPTIAPVPDVVTQVTQAANSIVPSILQAKAILAAWGKTDGINQGGLTDYGLNPADMSTTMGPRDTMMLQSFQAWDNKTLGDGLPVDGNLDSKSLQALQSWASARATASTPVSATPTVTPISLPAPPGSDPISLNPLPTVIPGGVIGGTDSPTGAPQVASKSNPATGGSGAMIAGGAVLGGLLFGLPGALIGAAAGAAVS